MEATDPLVALALFYEFTRYYNQ